jgi:uncharacterized protein DUF5715
LGVAFAKLFLVLRVGNVECGLVFIRISVRLEHFKKNVRRQIQSRLILFFVAAVAMIAAFSGPALAGSPRGVRSNRPVHYARSTRAARAASSTRTPRPAVRPAAARTSVAHTVRAHHPLWTPLFPPTHDSMVRQNAEVDRLDLPRIQNEEQLDELVASGDLLPITPNETLRIDPRLDPHRRYCRPWTLDFVNDLSAAFYREFHDQIQINSAVRTAEVQARLRRHNRNAAAESGDLASSHLAGITVDFQRLGMTMPEIKWVEDYLLPLNQLGIVEPEEESREHCFHVMVSNRYEDWRDPQVRAGTGSSASSTDVVRATPAESARRDEPVAP